MGMYLLKVNKKLYREGDHIAFLVYEKFDESSLVNGMLCNARHVEHYERLLYMDEKKDGVTNLVSTEEDEGSIFFEIKESDLPLIKEMAVRLTNEFPENYPLQYVEFLQCLSAQRIIRK